MKCKSRIKDIWLNRVKKEYKQTKQNDKSKQKSDKISITLRERTMFTTNKSKSLDLNLNILKLCGLIFFLLFGGLKLMLHQP